MLSRTFYISKIPRPSYALSPFSFPQRIARSSPIIVATTPSIFSVDFSLSGLMFPARSDLMKICCRVQTAPKRNAPSRTMGFVALKTPQQTHRHAFSKQLSHFFLRIWIKFVWHQPKRDTFCLSLTPFLESARF